MMERRGVRSEAEWQTMISELQALRRKLHSKSEALLIISKDLDATQKERDQFKLMAEKLRVRCQAYKRQFSDYPLTKDQASLIQMLRDTKNQKIAHQKQSEVLQQKLNEALGDVKLLRERFARQRIGDEGVGPRHFPAHEREELVTQLEDAKQQAEHYRQEFNIANDQVAELMAEKSELTRKSERLNNELNFMLNGDKKRIIDIDALCMENKYLQERVKQCQEEKNTLHAQMSKLKALLNSRKATSADIKPGKIRNSGLVISPKQVKELLMNRAGLPTSAETVSDLQSIAAALLETINDKNLALHHLRNTNKILGKRVAELELKLKTLEVAGLWTMAGQSRRPVSFSTPKVEKSSPSSTIENEEEFFSNLGSRLTKLTDACDKTFKEHKLVSLTPESSGSGSDVAGLAEDIIEMQLNARDSDTDISPELGATVSSTQFSVGATGLTEDGLRHEAQLNASTTQLNATDSDSDVTAQLNDGSRHEVQQNTTGSSNATTQLEVDGASYDATEVIVTISGNNQETEELYDATKPVTQSYAATHLNASDTSTSESQGSQNEAIQFSVTDKNFPDLRHDSEAQDENPSATCNGTFDSHVGDDNIDGCGTATYATAIGTTTTGLDNGAKSYDQCPEKNGADVVDYGSDIADISGKTIENNGAVGDGINNKATTTTDAITETKGAEFTIGEGDGN